MKTAKQLQEDREVLMTEMRTMLDNLRKEGKETMSKEQADRQDAIIKEVEDLDLEITRAQKRDALLASEAGPKGSGPRQRQTPEEKLSRAFSFTRAISDMVANRQFTGAEREVADEGIRELNGIGLKAEGFALPSSILDVGREHELRAMQKRDLNVTTSGDGGLLVMTEIDEIIPALRPRLVLESMGATVLTGLTGDVRFPRGSRATGVWDTETEAATESDPTLTSFTMSPKRLSTYVIESKQLLAQVGNAKVEGYVRRELEDAIRQAVDTAGIYGGGSNEPTGILATSGIGLVYAGGATGTGVNANGAGLVWKDVVNLFKEVAIDNADVGALGYLTTPQVLAYGSYTPRQTNGVEGNFIFNDPAQVYGFKLGTSTNVPSNLSKGSASDLNAMIFGNFADLMIGNWGGLDIVVDPYSLVRNAQVQIVVHSWWDIGIRQLASFAACKDLAV